MNSNLTLKTAEAQVIFMDGTMSKVEIDFNETNKKLGSGNTLAKAGDANRNTWFKYTEDDGVYTLTAVADQIVVAYGKDSNAKKSINCENARVTDGSKYAWGNDDSFSSLSTPIRSTRTATILLTMSRRASPRWTLSTPACRMWI